MLSGFSHLILEQARRPSHTIRRVLVGEIKRPPQSDGTDAECQELEDVRTEASTALREHLDLAKELGGFLIDLDGHLQRRGCRVDGPPTVLTVCQPKSAVQSVTKKMEVNEWGKKGHPTDIGKNDRRHFVRHRLAHILHRLHALQDHR